MGSLAGTSNEEDIKDGFFKKYWKIIVSFVVSVATFIAGFFIGKSTRRDNADFERLRATYEQLVEEHQQLVVSFDRLRIQLSEVDESTKNIAIELGQSEVHISGATGDIDELKRNTDSLKATNDRLRKWIQKYGTKIENISSSD